MFTRALEYLQQEVEERKLPACCLPSYLVCSCLPNLFQPGALALRPF